MKLLSLNGRFLAASAIVAASVAAAPSAFALTISIIPGPGLAANVPALAAFNKAALTWQNAFSDPILVTINADLAPLGAGILGSASSVVLLAPYNVIRNQMVTDGADEVDDGVVAFTPTAAQFTAFIPLGFSFTGNMAGTKANLKAMGFAGLDGTFGASDASITFSSNFAFDYDNTNGVTAGQYDFETVAAHEIGHALGFVSSVDEIDFYLSNNQTAAIDIMTLDVFRFGPTADPATNADFTLFPRNLLPGAAGYFDDLTNEWLMSTGDNGGGDGNQASHWKADDITASYIGIMDPTLSAGTIGPMTAADIRALDVIGWDNFLVAEPASGAVLGLALAAMAGLRRRFRR